MAVEMSSWSGMMANATAANGPGSTSIRPSEADDLGATAVSAAIGLSGVPDRTFKPMLQALQRNWTDPAGNGTIPANQVARPILDRIANTSDRATLERIRDGAQTMRNDVEQHRPRQENWHQSTPQLARIQDFAATIFDAASARLRALDAAPPQAPGAPASGAQRAPLGTRQGDALAPPTQRNVRGG